MGATRRSKKFQRRLSRLDTIPACDIQPSSHVATAIAALCYASLEHQEAQLMLTTGAMRLAVSRGQQTWYHFGSVATFR